VTVGLVAAARAVAVPFVVATPLHVCGAVAGIGYNLPRFRRN
jgi:hypothetical protein